jgi:hypothetical protein
VISSVSQRPLASSFCKCRRGYDTASSFLPLLTPQTVNLSVPAFGWFPYYHISGQESEES